MRFLTAGCDQEGPSTAVRDDRDGVGLRIGVVLVCPAALAVYVPHRQSASGAYTRRRMVGSPGPWVETPGPESGPEMSPRLLSYMQLLQYHQYHERCACRPRIAQP